MNEKTEEFEQLVEQFEDKKLTRRELVAALAADLERLYL